MQESRVCKSNDSARPHPAGRTAPQTSYMTKSYMTKLRERKTADSTLDGLSH